MISRPLRILIGAALLADAVSRLFNLTRIVSCFAMVAAIIFTAWRDDYVHTDDWPLAFAASAFLSVKLGQWIREEC